MLLPHHGARASSLVRRLALASARSARSSPVILLSTRCASTQSNPSKKYSDTLLLPKTDFPVRHKDVVAVEQRLRERVTRDYYLRQREENTGPVFVLHDGPPYANGDLHMGHALNKLLKDFINRWKAQNGYRVRYIPGWDCHGLPIEHKALKSLGKSHLNLSPLAVRGAARRTALEAIEVQKEQFRQLGIMADWDDPAETYRTLDTAFEIRQLKILRKMLEKGLVQHRRRPTYYSPSSRTALAEAELSYKDDHESRSVYVTFPVRKNGMSRGLQSAVKRAGAEAHDVGLAIWTTTPWTLAANQAVAVHSEMEYALVRQANSGKTLIAAKERLSNLEPHIGPLEVIADISGADLIGTQYSHLFWRAGLPVPEIIHSRYVTSAAGTGLVHSAPGHGKEDYEVYRQAFPGGTDGQLIRCPVDDLGRMTTEITEWAAEGLEVANLVGKEVLGDAVPAMISLMRDQGVLLAEERIKHRYPCDWKTKEPIIIRATPQWFADVEALKPAADAAMRDVIYKPEQSSSRLDSFVKSRSEWCISRQRSWGVPIPTLFEVGSDEPIFTLNTLDHIASVLAEKGTDHWWSDDVESFLTPELAQTGKKYKKGTDTMDVWFDSGTSWTLIDELNLRPKDEPVADVYLEGSDQHRGWFQSSLLTRLCAEEGEIPARAPYKELVTHGFVLDQEGNKMSKSAGNGLTPLDVIHGGKDRKKLPAFGTDVMRLWAASVDYTRDVSIGATTLSAAAENMRKVRNVFKFMLGNLSQGVDANTTAHPSLIDRYILHETAVFLENTCAFYHSHDFNKVLQAVNTFMNANLSTLYFDITKDALYSDAIDSERRKGIVSTLRAVAAALRDTLAPLTPHLVAEVDDKLQEIPEVAVQVARDGTAAEQMQSLLDLRVNLLPLFEEARNAKRIGSASDADLVLLVEDSAPITALLRDNIEDLPMLFGASVVHLGQDPQPPAEWSYHRAIDVASSHVRAIVRPAAQHKCPRCWRHVAATAEELCHRCGSVTASL